MFGQKTLPAQAADDRAAILRRNDASPASPRHGASGIGIAIALCAAGLSYIATANIAIAAAAAELVLPKAAARPNGSISCRSAPSPPAMAAPGRIPIRPR